MVTYSTLHESLLSKNEEWERHQWIAAKLKEQNLRPSHHSPLPSVLHIVKTLLLSFATVRSNMNSTTPQNHKRSKKERLGLSKTRLAGRAGKKRKEKDQAEGL